MSNEVFETHLSKRQKLKGDSMPQVSENAGSQNIKEDHLRLMQTTELSETIKDVSVTQHQGKEHECQIATGSQKYTTELDDKMSKANDKSNAAANKAESMSQSQTHPISPIRKCKYYMEKKKRHCLTVPKIGEEYCEDHRRIIKTMKQETATDKIQVELNVPDAKTSEELKAQPIPGRCQYFLEKKKRYCRTILRGESKYCVEHSHLLGDSAVHKRITCPLDPKHTCYESQLKKHLKKCNARDELQPVYFSRDINSGTLQENEEDIKATIRDISTEELMKLIETVRRLHGEHVLAATDEVLFHEALREETDKPTNGAAAQKHLQQQASLVGHLDKLGLLSDHRCYIEFGAGKGGLSHWVQKALCDCKDNQYLLVEKGSVRYKMDSFHKGQDQGPSFERLRIDIQHLNLGEVASLQQQKKPIVGTGKHLCGGATDLMLRCLAEVNEKLKPNQEKLPIEGVVLALCCHHRCDWRSYVGKAFIQRCGLTAREFHLLSSMCGWATCGTRKFLNTLREREKESSKDLEEESENPADKSTKDEEEHENEDNEDYSHPRYGKMTPEEREEIGYMCKQLMDTGRLHYLQDHGYQAWLVNYTSKDYTLEYVALLAKHKHSASDQ